MRGILPIILDIKKKINNEVKRNFERLVLIDDLTKLKVKDFKVLKRVGCVYTELKRKEIKIEIEIKLYNIVKGNHS